MVACGASSDHSGRRDGGPEQGWSGAPGGRPSRPPLLQVNRGCQSGRPDGGPPQGRRGKSGRRDGGSPKAGQAKRAPGRRRCKKGTLPCPFVRCRTPCPIDETRSLKSWQPMTHGPADCPGGADLPDGGGLSWLQRDPVCAGGGAGCGAADRSRTGRTDVHRPVHGQDGRVSQTVLPGVSARRRVRQADRDIRVQQVDRVGDHQGGRRATRDAVDRAGVRDPDLRRCVAVCGGVRGLPVRGRTIPPEQYSEATDSGDHCARRIHLHDGRPAGHAADPEHHPDLVLRHRHLGRADPRCRRRDLHPDLRHELSGMAPSRRCGRRRRLWRQSAE